MHEVRTHTRRDSRTGRAKTIRRHSRSDRGRKRSKSKRKSLARRGWKNAKKSYRYGRRHKKGMAALFGALAVTQVTAYVALQGVAYTAVTIGVVAVGVASLATAVSGGRKVVQ